MNTRCTINVLNVDKYIIAVKKDNIVIVTGYFEFNSFIKEYGEILYEWKLKTPAYGCEYNNFSDIINAIKKVEYYEHNN